MKFAHIGNVSTTDAFPRVQHTLGVQAFIDCGVRPSLLPLIADYFLDRSMVVQWHNTTSSSFRIPASTPQGSSFGVLEYLAISNDNSEEVPVEDKFKYQDDLSILDIVNLYSVGLSSHYNRAQVSSNLPVHNQKVDGKNLLTQKYLHQISKWTKAKQMKLNEKKTKAMIINMSKKYHGEHVEIIDNARLLGVYMRHIVKNGNLRLKVLHSAAKFTSNIKDLKIIYNQYVRSKLEYGCNVWNSGLTKQNRNDIERIQKSSCKIILGKNYKTYKKALKDLHMESLHDRRERLNLNFAKKSLKIPVMKNLFPLKVSKHQMKKRKEQKYQVLKAKTNIRS